VGTDRNIALLYFIAKTENLMTKGIAMVSFNAKLVLTITAVFLNVQKRHSVHRPRLNTYLLKD
jgi:hypothetical protein